MPGLQHDPGEYRERTLRNAGDPPEEGWSLDDNQSLVASSVSDPASHKTLKQSCITSGSGLNTSSARVVL